MGASRRRRKGEGVRCCILRHVTAGPQNASWLRVRPAHAAIRPGRFPESGTVDLAALVFGMALDQGQGQLVGFAQQLLQTLMSGDPRLYLWEEVEGTYLWTWLRVARTGLSTPSRLRRLASMRRIRVG